MTLDNDAIVNMLDAFDKETKALKDEALRFAWYMRGGLTYSEAMELSNDDRILIRKIIEDNLDTTKKTQLPFF